MIIERVVSAKSLWFGDMRQLNPRGRNIYKVIVPLAQRWYGFTAPQEFDEEKGVRFLDGEFSPSGDGHDLTGIDVTVYNNGLVATSTTTTDDTDRFLHQMLERLAKENAIVYSLGVFKRRWYTSEIIARSDKQLIIPTLDKVCEALSGFVYSGAQQFAFGGLILDVDPAIPGRQMPFRFERRADTPFSENLYYSHGPISTGHHSAILNIIEEVLAVP